MFIAMAVTGFLIASTRHAGGTELVVLACTAWIPGADVALHFWPAGSTIDSKEVSFRESEPLSELFGWLT